MQVVVSTEARFQRGPDGVIRTRSDGRALHFWQRYLVAFDRVVVVARVASTPSTDGLPVEGPRVEVHPVPDYVGLRGLTRRMILVRRAVVAACLSREATAYLARVPGALGFLMTSSLHRRSLPYALEVVGDPYTAMTHVAARRGVARTVARLGRWQLRRQTRRAGGVAYVTRSTLQNQYPPSTGATTATYSSVELPDAAFRETDGLGTRELLTFIAVSNLSQPYKGVDVLIRALAHLTARNEHVRLRVVGEGRLRPQLELLADELGVAQAVEFVGQLSSAQAVRAELDRAGIFVMPSLSEGLPRALLEAMARSLPCVASGVGGICELLPERDLVKAGDALSLATAMESMALDEARRRDAASTNFRVASLYHADILVNERRAFYEHVAHMSLSAHIPAARTTKRTSTTSG